MDPTGHRYHGDRPLEDGGADLLGFGPAAEAFADALVDKSTREGFVFGVEGPWGSGKTSLLRLTRAALTRRQAQNPTVIVPFSPWLVGERDALISEFFAEIAAKIQEAKADGSSASDAARALIDYAFRLGIPAARFAAALGTPGASIAAGGLEAAREAYTNLSSKVPLADLKRKLAEQLKALSPRIVVFIDDVDRLDPGEVMEILRLVRAVADFPNVVYVLAYDRANAARAVKKAIGMDGEAYLEKIVQATVPVPSLEAFDLRRMFGDGLAKVATAKAEDEAKRLDLVIDFWGGDHLRSPRDVNRTLDALRLVWPSLRDRVDLADLVWLQLLKVTAPRLYEWARDYATVRGAAVPGTAMVSSNDRTQLAQRFFNALGREMTALERHVFGQVFPGMVIQPQGTGGKAELVENVRQSERSLAIAGRRLASPDHWRLYFALTEPVGATTTEDLEKLAQAAAVGKDDVADLLRQWFKAGTRETGVKGHRVLYSLAATGGPQLEPEHWRSLLFAFADVLDEEAFRPNRNTDYFDTGWYRAQTLWPIIRARLGDAAAEATREAFTHGQVLGWLMDVVRCDAHAHGRSGTQELPESEWIFGHDELDRIIEIVHERLMDMDPNAILDLPIPGLLLDGWVQTGGGDAARAKIAEAIESDKGLITTIEILFHSIDRPHPRRRKDLSPYLDMEAATRRLERISSGDGKLAACARELLRKLSS